MSDQQEEDDDRYTLGLLMELRELCRQASDVQEVFEGRFHELFRAISNPNLPDIPKELPFRVEGYVAGTRERLRLMSVCGNIHVARAAFEETKRRYPNDRWLLVWAGSVVEDSMPLPFEDGGRRT